jgi:hypothetical protein
VNTLSQRSFAAGEVSPALYGRVDTVKYATGLKTCRNCFVIRHGGVASRAGTKFIGIAKNQNQKTRLVSFEFSTTQTYVIEFSHNVIRFIYNGGYLMDNDSIYEIASTYSSNELFELKFVQSSDVLTIAHPSHAPHKLSRVGASNWTLAPYSFLPATQPPTSGLTYSRGASGSTTYQYKITAINDETKEESLPSSIITIGSASIATKSIPHTIYWSQVTGASDYNIYSSVSGVYGFLGTASGSSFKDTGLDPDIYDTPPKERNPFDGEGNYPSTVTYVQQRLAFGNTNNNKQGVELSRTGIFSNFTQSNPMQDDDAVSFTISGRMRNEIKHILNLGGLIIFTSSGEWLIQGDSNGMVTPSQINMEQASYNGASDLPPIISGGTILYVQEGGAIVRDLVFDYKIDGYSGNELSIFSSHLVDGYTIVDWTYQKLPQSIVWMVRNDGVLLSMTYVREQEIVGWAKHDFHGGKVESITTVREGNEDAVYMVINRTINGSEFRYVERMASRRLSSGVDDIIDFVGMDSTLTYDGRNKDATHVMTLSSDTGWSYNNRLTLTSNYDSFLETDIGNEIHFINADNTSLRLTIETVTSPTVAIVTPHQTVPDNFKNTPVSNWVKAVDKITGMNHLTGKYISVFADRFVVSNPNNPAYDKLVVGLDGTVDLDRCYGVIHAGLPVTSDIETLDIDVFNSETLSDKKKNITSVTMMVEGTRGVFAGGVSPVNDSVLELTELAPRHFETYDIAPVLKTEAVKLAIKPNWSKGGRVFIRQSDPIPFSILSLAVGGLIPIK